MDETPAAGPSLKQHFPGEGPGASVAIAVDGKVVYLGARGLAVIEAVAALPWDEALE